MVTSRKPGRKLFNTKLFENQCNEVNINLVYSCLKALRVLQVNSHVPPDPAAFEYYARWVCEAWVFSI